jgi:hypothetical protein
MHDDRLRSPDGLIRTQNRNSFFIASRQKHAMHAKQRLLRTFLLAGALVGIALISCQSLVDRTFPELKKNAMQTSSKADRTLFQMSTDGMALTLYSLLLFVLDWRCSHRNRGTSVTSVPSFEGAISLDKVAPVSDASTAHDHKRDLVAMAVKIGLCVGVAGNVVQRIIDANDPGGVVRARIGENAGMRVGQDFGSSGFAIIVFSLLLLYFCLGQK